MAELLLELFSEEIPARMQAKAAEDLSRLVVKGLEGAGVSLGRAAAYATPRRLCLHIEDLGLETPAVSEEFKGPRVGAPPQALEGFLRKVGLSEDQLEKRADKKGEVWIANVQRPARQTSDILAELMPETIRSFPWPKSMRWGAGELRWVRPLRSILCLISVGENARVASFEVEGLASGDTTQGHRFLSIDKKSGAPKLLQVRNFKDYAAQLKRAKVLLDPAERAAAIEKEAAELAATEGLEVVSDPGLLREVAGLVEHPVCLLGVVDSEFQELPPEVLQTSMKEHQKFFSVRDPTTGKIVKFLTVSNMTADDGGARIVAGNERVLRARLADARFFYRNDLAKPLAENVAKLEAVTFHNQLGSQADRVARMRALASDLAPLVGAEPEQADRAALLAKADLASEMVYEFPELQGLMGRYYAEAAGEPAAVTGAIEGHYAPLGPTDDAPDQPIAIAVALADKLDSLAAFWTIGAKPTGSGDPFALRRAALGVIRIILDNKLKLRLSRAFAGHAERIEQDVVATVRRGDEVLAEGSTKRLGEWREAMRAEGMRVGPNRDALAMAGTPDAADRLVISRKLFDADIQADLLAFFEDRLKVYFRDHGARYDVVDAVLTLRGGGDDLLKVKRRVDALGALLGSEDGENLLAAYKRANNILEAEEKKDGVEYSGAPDVKYAEQDEERALFAALDAADAAVKPALKEEDYAAAMTAMAALRQPLDAFFDHVTVNAESGITRRNRLCLLHRLRQTMAQVANFAALEG
ncbi:MAG: glycine--tRNA ligase subunit beta [Rhodobacteraceae bacterium]|nr:glycine--tRNA ligase subunit beta [Paracoccaceae bacterium]